MSQPTTGGPNIAIIGAGLAGIAAAYHLRKSGLRFTVFEQSDGPGGTWWDNTYPGCEVDLPSHQYSYSFFYKYDWPRTHNKRAHLQAYCEAAIDEFDLRDAFRFGIKVEEARWDERRAQYLVSLSDATDEWFDAIISCVGLLNVPKYPDWPGLSEFGGPAFHSARWEHQHDLAGKRVAVVGTGSTAAQVVPAIAPIVHHLYVFQREPGWVVPKRARDYTDAERRRFRRFPILTAAHRWYLLYQNARRLSSYSRPQSRTYQQQRQVSLDFISETIKDPGLRAAVTPAYPFGCKRVVQDDNFYPALTRANVDLVPTAVASVTSTGVIDAKGTERAPSTSEIHDVWRDSEAFLGITVAGIPNFFMMYGPNTNGGGSITAVHERQAELIAHILRRMRRRRQSVLDTRPSVLAGYVSWLDHSLDRLHGIYRGGCHNYYFSPQGRNVTQMPLRAFGHWAACRLAALLLPLWSTSHQSRRG
jgi:cation diffusion facilitator CzcD-associated flavoprotein CzcO